MHVKPGLNSTVRRLLPTDLNALASTLEMYQRDPRMAGYAASQASGCAKLAAAMLSLFERYVLAHRRIAASPDSTAVVTAVLLLGQSIAEFEYVDVRDMRPMRQRSS